VDIGPRRVSVTSWPLATVRLHRACDEMRANQLLSDVLSSRHRDHLKVEKDLRLCYPYLACRVRPAKAIGNRGDPYRM
jgi:hypothetical protein